MNASFQTRDDVVTAVLGDTDRPVERLGPGRWRFLPENDLTSPIEATLKEGWLELCCEPALRCLHFPWDLLSWSAGLPGLAKFAYSRRGEVPEVRAEMPLCEAGDAAADLEAACRGFEKALKWLGDGGRKRPNPAATATSPDEALLESCRQSGRAFTEKDDGSLAVPLDTGRGPCEARVVGLSCDGVRVEAGLCEPRDQSGDQLEAFGLFLLTVSGALRMARATVEPLGRAFRFEVLLRDKPSPEEIALALSAVETACATYGPEAEALRSREIAGRYLRVRATGQYSTPTVRAVRSG